MDPAGDKESLKKYLFNISDTQKPPFSGLISEDIATEFIISVMKDFIGAER
jgi:hypothetical protein